MTRSLFLIPGTNYSFLREQNIEESVLQERELFMRLGENRFGELKNNEHAEKGLHKNEKRFVIISSSDNCKFEIKEATFSFGISSLTAILISVRLVLID